MGKTSRKDEGVVLRHAWKDMLKKCVERYCDVANEKTEPIFKVSSSCLDDHHFKKEELETVGALSKVCLHMV